MPWTCSSGVSKHCAGGDPFDPPVRTLQGEPVCLNCARELGLITPREERE